MNKLHSYDRHFKVWTGSDRGNYVHMYLPENIYLIGAN